MCYPAEVLGRHLGGRDRAIDFSPGLGHNLQLGQPELPQLTDGKASAFTRSAHRVPNLIVPPQQGGGHEPELDVNLGEEKRHVARSA